MSFRKYSESNSYQLTEQEEFEFQFSDHVKSSARSKFSVIALVSILFFVIYLVSSSDIVDGNLYKRKSFKSGSKYVRKEVRNMTDTELSNYFAAVWTLKNTGREDDRDYLLKYDDFVAQHMIATANSTVDQAHEYAAFLSWHSLLVMEFEIALQSIDSTVTIPYW